MFEYFVYVIKGINSNNKTKFYIGYTNNPARRIRQHNRELVGGAKATRGYKWQYYAIFANIESNILGLQIEWRLKHSTKKINIIDKLNSFFTYIDKHLKPSPNAITLNKKLFLYLNPLLILSNKKNNLIKPRNVIIIDTIFNETIIQHICNYTQKS